MARKAKTPKKATGPEKPVKSELFVGSSGEAVHLTTAVVQLLRHQFRVTLWSAGVFEASSNPLADLVRQLDKSAYGVFLFAKDDRVTSRGKQYEAARDNVLFELGLFMGRLGPHWRPRADCRNESYVCTPVGRAASAGGVLGFGSDDGFETDPQQTSVLETFGALLAAVVPPTAWWKPDKGSGPRG